MEITIKRMNECTMEEVLESWNKGWEGYYFNMTMGYDQYFARIASEGLSIPLSLIACAEGKPVGFLLNGIRILDGKKVGWNGGTAVCPEYRRHGVGRKLMEAALDVFRAEGCDAAILEAMSQNERAIALYEQYGYQTIDRLVLYGCEQFGEGTFGLQGESPYTVRAVPLSEAGNLPFYNHWAAWQTHWLSDRVNGEARIVADAEGNAVGYALCRRFYNLEGQLVAIVLTQCEALPERRHHPRHRSPRCLRPSRLAVPPFDDEPLRQERALAAFAGTGRVSGAGLAGVYAAGDGEVSLIDDKPSA